MTKVLYVFGGEKASGAEIVIERLISYNLDTIEPHLFISPGKFANELTLAKKPYPIVTINRLRKLNRSRSSALKFLVEALKNYFLVSSKVLAYAKRNNITHIHANTIVPASYLIPAIIYSRFLGKRKVWVWSDHDLQYFSKIDVLFSKLCALLFTKTLVVSEAVKRKYNDRKSVMVLYNGLDVNVHRCKAEDRGKFRESLNLLDNQIVFSIAATISPRKGQLQLIKVFKQLLLRYQHLSLVMAGSMGPDDCSYNARVEDEIKNAANIFYLGHIAKTKELYCGSDVLINNSNLAGGEPLGTTIYEAMSCNKVVIASDTGGTREIISNEEEGFVFKAEDEDALRENMEHVILHFQSLDTMRIKARMKVESKFSIDTMVANYNNYILN